MSFGISAAAWGAIAAGTVAATSVYSMSEQKKAAFAQRTALQNAQAEDARKTAEAEAGALTAANAKTADAKRRRRSSSLLASGGPSSAASTTDTLGGAPTVLASGAPKGGAA